MCTVSYLPLPHQGFIITSNRDEAPHRNAIGVLQKAAGTRTLLYPVDPAAGGSWFCAADDGHVACLLNGAYVPFVPDPQYTESRGTVLLNVLTHDSVELFAASYDFTRTAPFTLVVAGHDTLHELTWDGDHTSLRTLNSREPAFWSSVTLYPADVRNRRRALFDRWLSEHSVMRQEEIMHFHRYGDNGDTWNGFVMNRNERVKTLSITSALCDQDGLHLVHEDLITGETTNAQIPLDPAGIDKQV